MKFFFSTLLLSIVCLFASAQDEVKDIELTEGQKESVTIEFEYCKLVIYANSAHNGTGLNLTVQVENPNTTWDIYLFSRSYDIKTLKKQKIYFDKYSGGNENIMTCSGCRGDEIVSISPSGSRTLSFENVEESKLELPIYIVKNQRKKSGKIKKSIILRRHVITLNIHVKHEDIAEEEYQKLSTGYEDLIDELSKKPFCPRNSHRPSLDNQEKPYKTKIQEMLDEISEIKKENNWRERSEGYQRFKELKEKLEDIDFTKYQKWCGDCYSSSGRVSHGRTTVHQCSYCNRSLSDVVRSLDRVYRKLYGGASKSSVMGEVNALHKAWTGGCPALTKKKREDAHNSRQIDECYRKIENF